MGIYTAFIIPSQLTSPVNGYVCRRITKQNVKQFGFDSIEDLHKQYPDFPLMCREYQQKVLEASYKAAIKGRETQKESRKLDIESKEKEYVRNPSRCPKCNSIISFEKRNNRFCSYKCSNSRTQTEEMNRSRSLKLKKPENNRKQKNKKIGRPRKHIEPKYEYTRIKFCKVCNKVTTNISGKYCNKCAPNISLYRSRASFQFNVYDYPEEFNLSLIEEYGWYSPNGYKRRNKTPNLSGVSRDHLYSILDGFENNIDPNILSHPANCRIMIHNGKGGNNSKNRKSEITIEELLHRIEIWQMKYGGFPQI